VHQYYDAGFWSGSLKSEVELVVTAVNGDQTYSRTFKADGRKPGLVPELSGSELSNVLGQTITEAIDSPQMMFVLKGS
jgi:hypothetical protein